MGPPSLDNLGDCKSLAQMLKNPPAMQETRVTSLGQENPLEEEMATHSSILTWRIPWTEEPGEIQSVGSHRVRHDRATNTLKEAEITQDPQSPHNKIKGQTDAMDNHEISCRLRQLVS